MAHWRTFLTADAKGGRYLPWKEVARATGLSRTTAWRLQKRDDFPAPYAISPGRVAYREDEVEAWRMSRDHSAARSRTPTREAIPVQAPAASRADREVEPATPVRVTRPEPRTSLTSVAPARPRQNGRRRSQHARAIAQQMLFDF